MKRSALPLVCGVYGLVRMSRSPATSMAARRPIANLPVAVFSYIAQAAVEAEAMSKDDQIEAERIERLEENRKSWAEQSIDLDERFGPGSFGCHEAMHVTNMLAGLVEDQLCNHSAVLRDPRWFKLACQARDGLARLHQEIGAVHVQD